MYYQLRGSEAFFKWLAKIKDRQSRARIIRRIDKLAIGSFGDCKSIAKNLFELRMFFGPGYRVYYTIKETKVIFLLVGGDKASQAKDIAKALELLKSLEE